MEFPESSYEKGRRHEEMIAKRTGDRRVPGSGNQKMMPGDLKSEQFLREAKMTTKKGMSINGKWLEKLIDQSLRVGRKPVLELRFEGQSLPVPQDWVMIPASYFDELVNGEDE